MSRGVRVADGLAFDPRMPYNFQAKERVAAPASFNEDYVAAARHMNPRIMRSIGSRVVVRLA
jgi:hypothetical protein